MNDHRRLPRCLACTLAVVMLAASTMSMAGTFGNPAHKVVIQVSSADPAAQLVALHNAANLQKAFGIDNVRVEIVAYGPGLSLLTNKSRYPEEVPSLAEQGVRVSACHNTMEAIQRKTGHLPQLLDGVTVVPSGVARIVTLEEQGYEYIRP